jgi:hypothetical protein
MPSRDSLRRTFLIVGAAGLLAAALVHGLVNVPHLREDLLELRIRRSLVLAVSLVLYFSVVAMCGFAALVVSAVVSQMRGEAPSPVPLWVVAGTYVAFGIVAFVAVNRSPHFLGYTLMGIIVAVGAALGPPRVADGRA